MSSEKLKSDTSTNQISIQKKLYDELINLANIGSIVSHNLHDMGKLLTQINCIFDQIIYEHEANDSYRELINEGLDALKYLEDMFFRVYKTLSFRQSRYKKVVDILEDFRSEYSLRFQNKRINQRINFHGEHLDVEISDEIKIVLVNITENAIESFKDHHRKRYIDYDVYIEKSSVSIKVTDNGCGISEYIIDDIWEPWFSTSQKGLGLGLTESKRIVEILSGSIEARSDGLRGSEIIIKFPR